MSKHIRYALLPLVAVLTLAMTPAEAVSIGAGTFALGSQATPSQTQPLTKKQLKKQRKLEKKCAKYAAGKIKKAKKRAKYAKLCARPVTSTPPPVGSGVADGPGHSYADDSAGAGSAGGGTEGSNAGGGGFADEILDSPPIFTPPPLNDEQESSKGDEDGRGSTPQLPTPQLEEVPPTKDVPEPGSLALLALGLAGLGLARRSGR